MIFSKLMGQFVDVIQWTDDSPDTIVWRFERQGNEIKYGAKLTVREGQTAVFVNEGEIADTFTPGMYELYTRNLPILSTLQAWPHGFKSPFKAEVYFCQHAHLHRPEMGHQEPDDRARPGVRPGAAARLRHLRHPDQGPVGVPARGGRHRRALHRRRDQRPAAQHHRRRASARSSRARASRCSTSPRTTTSWASSCSAGSRRSSPITGSSSPRSCSRTSRCRPRSRRRWIERTSMGVVGDLSKYTQFQAAEAMRAAASNPGAAGQAIGMMVGMGVGQQASPWGARPAEPAARHPRHRRPPASPAYHWRSTARLPGPFGLEQLRQQAAGGGLTAASLVWAPGMAGWQPAGEVAELKPCSPPCRRRYRAATERMPAGPWGGLRTEEDERARGGVTVSSPQLRQFACEQCGAVLSYAPGTAELVCSYCGHRNRIVEATVEIVESPLDPALRAAGGEAPPSQEIPAKCGSCGADFGFKPPSFAGPCPFCGQPVVVDPGPYRKIRPIGILPFLIGAQEARRLVGDWLKGLWFAPSGDRRAGARARAGCTACTCPTGPSTAATRTRYVGRRGDVYYETQYVDAVVDGRRRAAKRCRCPRSAGRRPSGQVARDFDDVLVLAGETLPAHLVEALEPWDLDGMRPFTPDYLTGFARRALPAAGRRRLRAGAGAHARGDHRRHPRRHRRRPAADRADGGRARRHDLQARAAAGLGRRVHLRRPLVPLRRQRPHGRGPWRAALVVLEDRRRGGAGRSSCSCCWRCCSRRPRDCRARYAAAGTTRHEAAVGAGRHLPRRSDPSGREGQGLR